MQTKLWSKIQSEPRIYKIRIRFNWAMKTFLPAWFYQIVIGDIFCLIVWCTTSKGPALQFTKQKPKIFFLPRIPFFLLGSVFCRNQIRFHRGLPLTWLILWVWDRSVWPVTYDVDKLDGKCSWHNIKDYKFHGILHQNISYHLNLIFWIVMGCCIARFGRRGPKAT